MSAAAGAQQPAPTPSSLVFDGVTVVDVAHGTLLPAQRVVITGNRIQAVDGSGTVPIPKDAQVVKAQGKYLIPGLWDMHIHPWHFADFFFPVLIASGVTGVRDAGSDVPLDTLLQWRREILAGTRVGPPRQLNSSKYIATLQPGCKRDGNFEVCIADSADARHYVDSLQAAGADMIKVHGIPLDQIFVIAREARRVGLRVGGHMTFTAAGLAASDSGVGIFDHTEYGGLAALCLERPAASVATCQPVAERFRRNNTWWVPTLINSGPYGRVTSERKVQVDSLTREFWDYRTPFDRAAWLAALRGPPDSQGVLAMAQQVGMPFMLGTDASAATIDPPPGVSVLVEMVTLVTEGLTPLAALQAATLNPAQFLGATDSLGTVAPGKLADLVLLDGDPLADIANVAAIRAVVANGRYYDRATLDSLLVQLQAKAQKEGAPWDR